MTSFADIHLDRFEIFDGSAGAVGQARRNAHGTFQR